MGVSYRVSFGSDPIANAGGGVFGSFASVPGAIHLDEAGDMDVSQSASSLSSRLTMHCIESIYEVGVQFQIRTWQQARP